jgi:hypothetical protein
MPIKIVNIYSNKTALTPPGRLNSPSLRAGPYKNAGDPVFRRKAERKPQNREIQFTRTSLWELIIGFSLRTCSEVLLLEFKLYLATQDVEQ